MGSDVTWGLVTGLSPVEVRMAGDTISVEVGLKAVGLTLATNDKVLMVRVGQPSEWMIIAEIGAA